RDIRPAERLGYGARVARRAEERDHRQEPDGGGEETAPAPGGVEAVRIEDLEDGVIASADQIEIDEVHGRPRREEIQDQEQEIAVARKEVLGKQLTSGGTEDGDHSDGDESDASPWPNSGHDFDCRQPG